MANNKSIFTRANYFETRSYGRAGRVELLAQDVASELNTYKNFGVFPTYNDAYVQVWDENYELVTDSKEPNTRPGAAGVRSIFNKYSSVLTGSPANWQQGSLSSVVQNLVIDTQAIRMGQNSPLIDTPKNRTRAKKLGITVRELVQASQQGYFGRHPYSYSDFMYCKYLNRIPNNYLITLRRYPVPVPDSIMPTGYLSDRYSAGGKANTVMPIGTMVTWLGAPGNPINNILKYEYNMPFEEVQAQWHDINQEGGNNGILNQLDALVDPAARKQFMAGNNAGMSTPLAAFTEKFIPNGGSGAYSPFNGHEDQTKIYGPIDRVKSNYRRSDQGLKMEQKFDLVFEYELKAYNGINPRQALIDLLGNILSTTYTTGGFWPGGYRSTGMRQGSIFSNMSVFKVAEGGGSFTDMVDAFTNDINGGLKKAKEELGIGSGEVDADGNPINTIKNLGKKIAGILNNIGGVLMGGLLNKLGRPAKYHMNSLISEQPVGLWHITIGNPHRPIMSLGNMILTNTSIEHYGPLGMDDFPTGLKVTCSFSRGKPRDQVGIEHMYTGGEIRAINSMEGKVVEMYKVAAEYMRNPDASVSSAYSQLQGSVDMGTPPKMGEMRHTESQTSDIDEQNQKQAIADANKMAEEANSPSKENYNKELSAWWKQIDDAEIESANTNAPLELLAYYFGNWDTTAALYAAKEADRGAFHKKPPEEMTPDEVREATS